MIRLAKLSLFALTFVLILVGCGLGLNSLIGSSGLGLGADASSVLWLRFQEAVGSTTFSDSSGNVNHASCNSGQCPTVLSSGVVQFDGINDFLTIADSSSLDFSNSFSLRFWFSPTSSYSTGSSPNFGFFDKGVWEIFLNRGNGKLGVVLSDSGTVPAWTLVNDGTSEAVFSFADYKGHLYYSEGTDAGDGDIFYCDPSGGGNVNHCDNAADFAQSFNGSENWMATMTVYNGKLYAGQAQGPGDGDIFICDPTLNAPLDRCDNADWSVSFNGAEDRFNSLVSFRGKLYAGQGSSAGDGDVLVCDPAGGGNTNDCDNAADWSTSLNGAEEFIAGLIEFNGKLYAGQGSGAGDGDIFMCDPEATGDANTCEAADWSTALNGTTSMVIGFAEFQGRLYANLGLTAGEGDVLVCNPENGGNTNDCDNAADWSTSLNGSQEEMPALVNYKGSLFGGQGADSGDGDTFVCDPTTGGNASQCDAADWSTSRNGTAEFMMRLATFNGRLYSGQVGQPAGSGEGDLFSFGNGTALYSSSESWTTGWHHVTVTYDGTTLSIYKNGVLETSLALSFPMETNSRVLYLGKSYGSRIRTATGGVFAGRLGEVVLLDRTLSSAEILSDFQTSSANYN